MKQKHAIYAGLLAIGIASTGPATAQLLPYPPAGRTAAPRSRRAGAFDRARAGEPSGPPRAGLRSACRQSVGPRGPRRRRCPARANRPRGSAWTRAPGRGSRAPPLPAPYAGRRPISRFRMATDPRPVSTGCRPMSTMPNRMAAAADASNRMARLPRSARCRCRRQAGRRRRAGPSATPSHEPPVRSSAVTAAAAETRRRRAGRAARVCGPVTAARPRPPQPARTGRCQQSAGDRSRYHRRRRPNQEHRRLGAAEIAGRTSRLRAARIAPHAPSFVRATTLRAK